MGSSETGQLLLLSNLKDILQPPQHISQFYYQEWIKKTYLTHPITPSNMVVT